MAKFCPNCGNRMEDDDVFCGSCGASVSTSDLTPPINTKKPLKKPLIIALAALAVLVVAGIAGFVLFNSNRVNLNDYAEIIVEGCDGYGRAHMEFDYKAFDDDYHGKIEDSEGKRRYAIDNFADLCFAGALDQDTRLSNGDTVTFSWDFDEEEIEERFGVKLKYTDIDLTVDSLDEVGSFDPFENLSVTFEGVDGYGTAYINPSSKADYVQELWFQGSDDGRLSNGDSYTVHIDFDDWDAERFAESYGKVPSSLEKTYTVEGLDQGTQFDPFEFITVTLEGFAPNGVFYASVDSQDSRMDNVYLDIDKDSGLSNGDEVTVTLMSYWDDDTESLLDDWAADGYTPTAVTKTYEIEGLPEYITSLSQIPEDAMTSMMAQAEDTIVAQTAQEWNVATLTGMTYNGCVLLTSKGDDFYTGAQNMFYLVYTVSGVHNESGEAFNYYHFMRYEDLYLDTDGTCAVDLSDYATPSTSYRPSGSTYSVRGYESLQALLTDCVNSRLDSYTYETDLPE